MAPQVPVLLEIVAHVPTDFFHCLHCERAFGATGISSKVRSQGRKDYPPDVLEDASQLSAWLQELAGRYGQQLRIRVVDTQSPEGLWKSLRHRVRDYPAFIINRRVKHAGWDQEALERLLAKALGSRDMA